MRLHSLFLGDWSGSRTWHFPTPSPQKEPDLNCPKPPDPSLHLGSPFSPGLPGGVLPHIPDLKLLPPSLQPRQEGEELLGQESRREEKLFITWWFVLAGVEKCK